MFVSQSHITGQMLVISKVLQVKWILVLLTVLVLNAGNGWDWGLLLVIMDHFLIPY